MKRLLRRGWLGAGCLGLVLAAAGADRAAAGETVGAVVMRWRQALGGLARLTDLSVIDTRQQYEFGAFRESVVMHTVQSGTGKYLVEIDRPQTGLFIQAFDGKHTWMSNDRLGFGLTQPGAAFTPVRPEEIWFAVILDKVFPHQTLLGDGAVKGQACSVLLLAGLAHTQEKWYFAKAGGLLVRVETANSEGLANAISADYSDFRAVDGIMLPFAAAVTQAGATTVIRRLAARVNPPLPASIFSPSAKQLNEAAFVNSLLERHLASVGGWAAGSAIHSRVTHFHVEVLTSGVKKRVTVSQKSPDLILVESDTTGMGHSAEGYDGATGWTNSEIEGYRLLDANEVQQLKTEADLLMDARLALRSPLRRLRGSRMIDGRLAFGIELANQTSPLGTYYFDQTNGRLVRIASALMGDSANSLLVTADYSDFRTIDGVDTPFVISTTNPAVQFVTTIDSVQNNVKLDNAIFRPQRDD